MSLARLIPLLLQASLAAVVIALALRSQPGDMTYLLRRPGKLLRSMFAMFVIMPVLTALIVSAFHLKLAVEAALVLLAVSPVPPILPGQQTKAGGSLSYALGLLMFSAVLAIVTVPLSVWLIGKVLGRETIVPFAMVAKTVVVSVIGPLLVGVVVKRLAPAAAEKIAGPLAKVGTLLLLLAFLPVLVTMWGAIVKQVGDFTLVAIVVITGLGLLVGHLLGGPAPEDRPVLGLATACRHPGVAMTIASAIAAPENKPLVSSAVMLCVLVAPLVTVPYTKWRAKRAAAAA
jgi:BASS family bile acid:Na+ symporter